MRKLFIYFWSLRRQFTKYFITGISGLVIDMGSLIILKEIFGWRPVTAVVANQAVLLVYIFLMNKYWSFRDRSQPRKQVVRFLILACFNYAFAVAFMYGGNHLLNFDYRLVRLVSIAMMVSWNFFLYKYWVYKSEEPTFVIPAPERESRQSTDTGSPLSRG